MEFATRTAEAVVCACAVESRHGADLARRRGVSAEDFTDARLAALFAAACDLPDLRGDLERTLRPMTLDAWREWTADELVPPAFAELGETEARCEAVTLVVGADAWMVRALVDAPRPVLHDTAGEWVARVVAASVARASAAMTAARVEAVIAASDDGDEIVRLATALETGDRVRLICLERDAAEVVERREVA